MDAEFINEVETALKHYRHADRLTQHKAVQWSTVIVGRDQAASYVAAIRRVLDKACATVETAHPEGARLIRGRYMLGQTIEDVMRALDLTEAGFHRLRNHMVAELAVTIAEENRRAARRLRYAQTFTNPLPVFGVTQIVSDIVKSLEDPEAPLVTVIEGMGGMGKTTLARMVAQSFVDNERVAGLLWITAQQVQFDQWSGQHREIQHASRNADDFVRDLARQLEIDVPGDIRALLREVSAHCKRNPYLIFFDNMETVSDMQALATMLSALIGPSRVIITTRERTIQALPPSIPRHHVTLEELDEPNSYLLLRRAAEFTRAYALARASDQDLSQIYAVTGGNPLAMWLVAGQAWSRPWADFIHDLAQKCPQGSKGYALYEYLYRASWDSLTDNGREVLFAMHRCQDGADFDLLLELSGLSREDFLQAVDELTNRMLLQFSGVYRIHRLTYTFLRTGIVGWWAHDGS